MEPTRLLLLLLPSTICAMKLKLEVTKQREKKMKMKKWEKRKKGEEQKGRLALSIPSVFKIINRVILSVFSITYLFRNHFKEV